MKNINCNFQVAKNFSFEPILLMKLYNTTSKREIVYMVQIEKKLRCKSKSIHTNISLTLISSYLYLETFCLADEFLLRNNSIDRQTIIRRGRVAGKEVILTWSAALFFRGQLLGGTVVRNRRDLLCGPRLECASNAHRGAVSRAACGPPRAVARPLARTSKI